MLIAPAPPRVKQGSGVMVRQIVPGGKLGTYSWIGAGWGIATKVGGLACWQVAISSYPDKLMSNMRTDHYWHGRRFRVYAPF